MRAIPAPGAGPEAPRGFFDKLNEWARAEGAGGLGYIIFEADGAKGPIAKNLEPDRAEAIRHCLRRRGPGDAGLSSPPASARDCAEIRRRQVAHPHRRRNSNLIEKNAFRFCWITDFPMYELNEETGLIDFSHNPFSMPQGGMEALETQDPLTIKAFQYDIVCNGIELSAPAPSVTTGRTS